MEEKELTGGAAQAAEESSDAGSKGSATRKPIATDGSATDPTDQSETRRERYRALVTGEFKDLYTADTQRIIDRRFKETRALQETLEAQRPVLERLMERYAVGGVADLAAAIEAEERERADRDRERQERWNKEVEETRGTYPQFDMEEESSHPLFLAMLEAGAPVKLAYEAMHLDQIMAQALRAAEKRLADHIRSGGARPQENGASAQTAVASQKDVGRLTAAERAEFARRAARGETITFR